MGGAPLRVDLCRGPLVTVADVEGLSTFAGVKRSVLGDDSPPPGPRPPEDFLPRAGRMADGLHEPREAAIGLAAMLPPCCRIVEMRWDRLDPCRRQQRSQFTWRSFL